MLLVLSRTPEQQAALDKLVEEQHTAGSSKYHRWLAPADIGRMFGAADSDVEAVSAWLRQQGFTVRRVSASKTSIEFSGSAGQVRRAFHTEIHKYIVNGEERWANAKDPQIPAALASIVNGPVSLNNFAERHLARRAGAFTRDAKGQVTPAFTVSNGTSTYYAIGPADFATIYNTQPLLQAGTNGAGQTIAVIGRSNVHLQDVADFRNLFGLGAGNTSVILDGPDPGIVSPDEDESVLDLERANGTAPGATVVLVSAQDTETTSGIDLAALYAVENNVAGVISVSYGDCEAHLGTARNQFIESLWEQAAAEGITVVVSSGDDGSAGCDDQEVEVVAQSGLAVNSLASTAYNVAVGGTDFDDLGTQSSYWNSTNNAGTWASALSYIPETAWNESCAASATAGFLNACPAVPTTGTPAASLQLWAGSGGASSCAVSSSQNGTSICQSGRAKPAWQSGAGVPADRVRDLPDIALFSATASSSHSFYVVCQADALPPGYQSCQSTFGNLYFIGAGGTSAAAPSFAGLVTLAEQKVGGRLGNLNYLLYSLASGPGASCASASSSSGCVFNDVVKGNNSVPCQAGSNNCSQSSGIATGVMADASGNPAYTAVAGYDLATGLGSVNAANLVNAIANAASKFTPSSTVLTLNGATAALTVQHGNPINVGVTVNPSAATGDVSLLGSSGSFDFNPLSNGSANWTSTLFPGGSYTVKAHYPGDGTRGASDSNGIPITISPESSLSFVNLVTFNNGGGVQSFTGNSVVYGSPYLLRMDVTDASGSVSSSTGMTSKCASHTASCPTGTVALTANGSALDAGSFKLNSNGFAEDQLIQLQGGSYTLAAAYSGDPSYSASTGSSTVTVSRASTSLTVGTPVLAPYEYGRSFQVNGNLSTTSNGAAPTGNLNFFDNGAAANNNAFFTNPIGHAGGPNGPAGASYDIEYAPPSVGTHTVSAQYPGNGNYASSISSTSFTFTALKGTTHLSGYGIDPRTATPNFAVTLLTNIQTLSALAHPTGTVTFTDNGVPMLGNVTYTGTDGSCCSVASLDVQMQATFSQLGTHDIVMSYSGDGNYNAISQDLGTLTVVDKIATTINLLPFISLAANSSLWISPTISSGNTSGPLMTGTVTFQDDSTPIPGAVRYSALPGSMDASVFYAFPTPGTHNLTISYSGDNIYAASTQTFQLKILGPLAVTFPGGLNNPTYLDSAQSATANVQVFVLNSTNNTVTASVSCSSSSAAATCSPSPSSVTAGPYASPIVMLNISVAPHTSALHHTYPFTFAFAFGGVLAGVLCRRRLQPWLLMLLLVMIIPMASCGGGGGTGGAGSSGTSTGSISGTYNFTVTATSGTNTDTETFSVTFQ